MRKFTLAFTLLIILTGCKKQGATYNVYFYTTSYDEYTPLYLFINDENKGELPLFTQKMSFDNDSLKSKALLLHLNYDTYPILGRDKWNNVKVEGTMRFKRKKMNVTNIIGEIITEQNDKDIIIEVDYR